MAIPHIPRRWRLRTLMLAVAACALGLAAHREYVVRGPIYRDLYRLRFGDARARSAAATRLGMLSPRAPFADEALIRALDDPDRSVRADVMFSLIRLGWRSPRLLPILAEEIERMPEPGLMGKAMTFELVDPPKGWTVSAGGLCDNDPMAALSILRPDARVFVPMLKAASKSPTRWGRDLGLGALFACATWSDPSGPELADALLAVLDDYRLDPRVVDIKARGQLWDRHRAAEALARLDRPARERAVARLVADLCDLGSPRSYEAVALLRRFEGGKALVVTSLRDRIRDGDEDRRRIAMVILGYFGEVAAPAAPDVLRAITGPDADHRDGTSATPGTLLNGSRIITGPGAYRRGEPLGRLLKWWVEVARSEQSWESAPRVRLDFQRSTNEIGVGV
jgi:hypothetical protein